MEEFEGVKREEKKKKERHCTEQNRTIRKNWTCSGGRKDGVDCIALQYVPTPRWESMVSSSSRVMEPFLLESY